MPCSQRPWRGSPVAGMSRQGWRCGPMAMAGRARLRAWAGWGAHRTKLGHRSNSGTAPTPSPTTAERLQSTTAGFRPVNPDNSAFAHSPAGVRHAEAADPWMDTQRIRGRRHFNPAAPPAPPALNAPWLVIALSTVPRLKPQLKDVSLYTGADADNQLHQFVPDWKQPREVKQRRDRLNQAAEAQEADYLTGTLSAV